MKKQKRTTACTKCGGSAVEVDSWDCGPAVGPNAHLGGRNQTIVFKCTSCGFEVNMFIQVPDSEG